jgi:hypothetical protein
MDGSRFDALTRSLARPKSRRTFLSGVLAIPIGPGSLRVAGAACLPNRVYRRTMGCVCNSTGRPPGPDGLCPCPNRSIDCGGRCADITNDRDHCGACGNVCPVDRPFCVGGACVACRRNADCDDDVACTVDACVGGDCRHTPNHAACEDGNPCTTGRCDPVSGCVVFDNEGAQCEVGDLCSTGDACRGGICQRGHPVDCGDLTDSCNDGVCDPTTGGCVARPEREGERCDPGDPCLELATCRGRQCLGTPVDCGDLDGDCTVGVCDAAERGCVARAVNEGDSCRPIDGCFAHATCVDAACRGDPVDCTTLDAECARGVCDDVAGACRLDSLADGTECGDGGSCCAGSCCFAACSISGQCLTCLPAGSVACQNDADCCGDLICAGAYPVSTCLCRAENHGPCD